jgi:hypothetical protein
MILNAYLHTPPCGVDSSITVVDSIAFAKALHSITGCGLTGASPWLKHEEGVD